MNVMTLANKRLLVKNLVDRNNFFKKKGDNFEKLNNLTVLSRIFNGVEEGLDLYQSTGAYKDSNTILSIMGNDESDNVPKPYYVYMQEDINPRVMSKEDIKGFENMIDERSPVYRLVKTDISSLTDNLKEIQTPMLTPVLQAFGKCGLQIIEKHYSDDSSDYNISLSTFTNDELIASFSELRKVDNVTFKLIKDQAPIRTQDITKEHGGVGYIGLAVVYNDEGEREEFLFESALRQLHAYADFVSFANPRVKLINYTSEHDKQLDMTYIFDNYVKLVNEVKALYLAVCE